MAGGMTECKGLMSHQLTWVIGLVVCLFGLLLLLGVVGVLLGSFLGPFPRVFLTLALGSPFGCRLLASLCASITYLPGFLV